MQTVTSENFGLTIAYLLPGFVLMWGFSGMSDTVAGWLGGEADRVVSVGGFLYVTLASLGLGVVASTLRWAIIDTIHRQTGLAEPNLDFANFSDNFEGFEGLVRNHYRFYQFHANMLISLVIAYGFQRVAIGLPDASAATDAAVGIIALILFIGSRDTLRKYDVRTKALLASAEARCNCSAG